MYGLSALFTLGIWPYTILGMMPTNKKLFQKVVDSKGVRPTDFPMEVGVPKGETSKELIDHWGILNLGRGMLPL